MAKGGQSALSSDANQLVLCSPLRPAQHIAAAMSFRTLLGGRRGGLARCLSPLSHEPGGKSGVCGHLMAPGVARARLPIYSGLPFWAVVMGRRLLYILTSLYFDDAHITDWASSKGSAQASFSSLNAKEKRQTMHPRGTNLGLDFDFSTVCESCGVTCLVQERLRAKVVGSSGGVWDVAPRGSLQALRSLERPYWGRRLGSPQRPPAGTRYSHHRKIADLL